jgi:hypothetical protein
MRTEGMNSPEEEKPKRDDTGDVRTERDPEPVPASQDAPGSEDVKEGDEVKLRSEQARKIGPDKEPWKSGAGFRKPGR